MNLRTLPWRLRLALVSAIHRLKSITFYLVAFFSETETLALTHKLRTVRVSLSKQFECRSFVRSLFSNQITTFALD